MTQLDLTSLDAVAGLVDSLPGFDASAAEGARARQLTLTKPPASLGRLEELAEFMAGWQATPRPQVINAQAVVFAGNHGVCDQGVNPFPQAVTGQMVANFEAGGAAINQLCKVAGAALTAVPLDLDHPTRDFTTAPAMTEAETLDAMRTGMEAVDSRADVLILGEMGIGNSTVSAALACALLGGDAGSWVGRGTGSDSAGMARKAAVVARGVEMHRGLSPMQTLAALGGREQAAICGAVLAARQHCIPVLLDGYICTAAVTPLFAAAPGLLDHCLVGHASAEPGHKRLCDAFGHGTGQNAGYGR